MTVVSLSFQSLKVPDSKMVTDEYAFMLKLVLGWAAGVVAMFAIDGIRGDCSEGDMIGDRGIEGLIFECEDGDGDG